VASRIGGVRDAAERGVGRRVTAARLRASASCLAAAWLLLGCVTIDLPLGGRGELEERVVLGSAGPKLLLLDLDGVLSEEDEEGSLGFGGRESAVARVREQLERAREDAEVRGVLLRIHSPGGTVTASDVIYREILRFKEETKRPVVAQCMGLCASGGYYVAMAADRVLAHPTSVTGSIGVIFSGLSLAGLLEKLGVEDQTLTSGPFKDAGSPLRRMTPEEREQLQSVIDDLFASFVEVVRRGRPALAADAVTRLADGRIYSARQAQQAGLVDALGYLPEAVDELKQRAGVAEARVVVYRRPREWSENLYSASGAPEPRLLRENASRLAAALGGPAFLYLWWPGR
jgi:protease-4